MRVMSHSRDQVQTGSVLDITERFSEIEANMKRAMTERIAETERCMTERFTELLQSLERTVTERIERTSTDLQDPLAPFSDFKACTRVG